jgi:hypothetical protein
MTPEEYEELITQYYKNKGYSVEKTPRSYD